MQPPIQSLNYTFGVLFKDALQLCTSQDAMWSEHGKPCFGIMYDAGRDGLKVCITGMHCVQGSMCQKRRGCTTWSSTISPPPEILCPMQPPSRASNHGKHAIQHHLLFLYLDDQQRFVGPACLDFCLDECKHCSTGSSTSVEWHAPSVRNRPLQNKCEFTTPRG